MEQMDRTARTDERIDDAFAQLRDEMREMRAEMRDGFRDLRQEMHSEFRDVRADAAQMKLLMLGGLITILAAFIALGG
jgi:DNA-binding GntR family transcriptional regulator